MKNHPPKQALKFLRWFCREDYIEEIEGDLVELFEKDAGNSPHWAGLKFVWNVITHFRPSFIRSFRRSWMAYFNTPDMIKNYMLIGWRNILKNKMVSFINLAGFSLGFIAAIFIALYVTNELSFDRYHEKSDRIYRIIKEVSDSQGEHLYARTSARIGPASVENFTGVQQAVRLSILGRLTAGYGTFRDYEPMFCVDSTFFEIFDCKFIAGDPDLALREPYSVVLTERLAEKYFGNEPPLGKILYTNRFEATVTGVIENFPSNSHLDPPLLFSLSTVYDGSADAMEWMRNDWSSNEFGSYLLLSGNADAKDLSERITAMAKDHLPDDQQDIGYSLQPLSRIHFYSGDMEDGYNVHEGKIAIVYIFTTIGFLILFIAFTNYINLATARAIKRMKEIGLRKTVGASRTQLISQFMGESMLVVIMTLVIAVGMVYVLTPYFNQISGKELHPDLLESKALLILLGGGLISGILAGGYPAFYLSRLKPSMILKNVTNVHRKNYAGRVLLVIQFAVATIMIAATIMISRQMDFIRNKDLGYNRNQLVTVDINSQPMRQQHEAIKNSMLRVPGVKSVTITSRVPGEWKNLHSATVIRDNSPVDFIFVAADEDFIPAYEITLLEGRNFNHTRADSGRVLINEEAVKVLGLKEPVGAILEVNEFMKEKLEKPYTVEVIGVIKNVNFQSVRERVVPTMVSYYLNPFYPIDYYTLRLDTRNLNQAIASVEEIVLKFDPENPMEYHFLDDKFEELYLADTRRNSLFRLAAFLGIFIACIGLFGLTNITLEKSVKEIGVRKVLGAGIMNITLLISGRFIRLIGIAFIIAMPVAWWLVGNWMNEFAYHTRISAAMMLMAGMIVLTIAVLTVSIQTIAAAKINPVKSLRDE